jgi:hypothetical protein
MNVLLRWLRILVALTLAWTAGTLPACGSMGGGMKGYLSDPPETSQSRAT